MHLVQVLASLSLGGSELVAVELSEFAVAEGHRVTVIAGDGPLGDRLRRSGARLLAWPVGRKHPVTLCQASRLRRWLRDEGPDLLHAHSRLPAWICRFALRGLPANRRPAFVTSVHGHYSVSPYSAVMAGGDRVIAVSGAVRGYILRNYPATDPARVAMVPGGVSRRLFRHGYRPPTDWFEGVHRAFPRLRGRRWLCLPGRLSRYKGHAVFIDLLARLRPVIPDVHGVIIGASARTTRYRDELQGLANRLGIPDGLTFTGPVMNMREWMAGSEIVFSLTADPPEAFGRTVPEALHLGVPVIGWAHGGVGETLAALFPDGAVEPGDREELLRRSLAFLEQRPPVAPSTAYGLQESMSRTFDVYRDLVGART